MNLIPVENIPIRKYPSCLKDLFEEFMNMDANIAAIDPIKEGYRDFKSGYRSIYTGVRKHGYYNRIRVISSTIDKKVYLQKIFKEN